MEQVRHEWVKNWPGQVVLAVTQMFWTLEVQQAIDEGGSNGLRAYSKTLGEVQGSQLLVQK